MGIVARRTRELKLIECCPEYLAALDAFEADPTEENWLQVTLAASLFRTKVKRLEPA